MKKIKYILVTSILVILINGCSGYKPIFTKTDINFYISSHTIAGDQALGQQLFSKLNKLSDSDKINKDVKKIDLEINTKINKNISSKDATGKALQYKITLNTKIVVNDFKENNKIFSQDFIYSTIYKVQDQISDTKTTEKAAIENLINRTYQDLLIKLSQNIIKQ
jgi:hypothetical protein